jgi:hypothetical protein
MHRHESVTALRSSLADDLAEARTLESRGGLTPAELERLAKEAAAVARAAATERDDLAERARATRERVLALERAIGEHEGLPPAARALAEQGEQIALATIEVDPGSERAVAAALGRIGSALLAADPHAGLELLRRAVPGARIAMSMRSSCSLSPRGLRSSRLFPISCSARSRCPTRTNAAAKIPVAIEFHGAS